MGGGAGGGAGGMGGMGGGGMGGMPGMGGMGGPPPKAKANKGELKYINCQVCQEAVSIKLNIGYIVLLIRLVVIKHTLIFISFSLPFWVQRRSFLACALALPRRSSNWHVKVKQ